MTQFQNSTEESKHASTLVFHTQTMRQTSPFLTMIAIFEANNPLWTAGPLVFIFHNWIYVSRFETLSIIIASSSLTKKIIASS